MDLIFGHDKRGFTMLVLTRKNGEAVVVGGADRFERLLKVTVLEIKGRSVRLGFEADTGIPVHRSEIWDRMHSVTRPTSPEDGPNTPASS